MDFGRLPYDQLDHVDFRLPADPLFNRKVLSGHPHPSPKTYVGSNKWGRKEWIGLIYPKGTKDKEFLDHYVTHFNSIELNATHYKLYDREAIQKWKVKAEGYDFLFCPKIYQGISHYGTLTEKQFLLDTFLGGVTAFEDRLGPIWHQCSDKLAPKRKLELFNYLRTIPRDINFFVEIRQEDWFSKRTEFDDVINQLRQLNIGLVCTDTAGRRDVVHCTLTAPKAFIRFCAYQKHPTNYKRLDDWIERIRLWLALGLEELYFFFHCDNDAFTPEISSYFIHKLNKEFNFSIRSPKF